MGNDFIIKFLNAVGVKCEIIQGFVFRLGDDGQSILVEESDLKILAFNYVEENGIYSGYNIDEWFAENEYNCRDETKLKSTTGATLLEAIMKLALVMRN